MQTLSTLGSSSSIRDNTNDTNNNVIMERRHPSNTSTNTNSPWATEEDAKQVFSFYYVLYIDFWGVDEGMG